MADLEAVTAAAFGRRRKMLRSALNGLVEDPLALLSQAGIEPTVRAETLAPEAFCALAPRARADQRSPLSRLTKSGRPICRSRRSRSAARIARTLPTLSWMSRLTTTKLNSFQ